jgi:predicted protein tyrosine phosphatase
MLIVSPVHCVSGLIASRAPSHLISLCSSPDDLADLPPWSSESHLRLCFHDITEAREGLVAPDGVMVGTLLDFARPWDGSRPLLIHCWAGISRSCAAAFILACERNAGREQEIATELRRRAPFATPNRLMVRLADDILGRAGRMVDAVDAIGRGAEAPHGEPFDFPAHRWAT